MPNSYNEGFEQGQGFVFDDAVGVLHVRQSGSTFETDYAPGIPASQGQFYARLLVQSALASSGGINEDQSSGPPSSSPPPVLPAPRNPTTALAAAVR